MTFSIILFATRLFGSDSDYRTDFEDYAHVKPKLGFVELRIYTINGSHLNRPDHVIEFLDIKSILNDAFTDESTSIDELTPEEAVDLEKDLESFVLDLANQPKRIFYLKAKKNSYDTTASTRTLARADLLLPAETPIEVRRIKMKGIIDYYGLLQTLENLFVLGEASNLDTEKLNSFLLESKKHVVEEHLFSRTLYQNEITKAFFASTIPAIALTYGAMSLSQINHWSYPAAIGLLPSLLAASWIISGNFLTQGRFGRYYLRNASRFPILFNRPLARWGIKTTAVTSTAIAGLSCGQLISSLVAGR